MKSTLQKILFILFCTWLALHTQAQTFNPFTTDTLKYCGQDSVLLDINASYSTIVWNTGETTQAIWAKQTGLYKVTVSDGVSTYSDSVFVQMIAYTPPVFTTYHSGQILPETTIILPYSNYKHATSFTVPDTGYITSFKIKVATTDYLVGGVEFFDTPPCPSCRMEYEYVDGYLDSFFYCQREKLNGFDKKGGSFKGSFDSGIVSAECLIPVFPGKTYYFSPIFTTQMEVYNGNHGIGRFSTVNIPIYTTTCEPSSPLWYEYVLETKVKKYVFISDSERSNYTDTYNEHWIDNQHPPVILPAGSEIRIKADPWHLANNFKTSCVMYLPQIVGPCGVFIVEPGANLIIDKNLSIKK